MHPDARDILYGFAPFAPLAFARDGGVLSRARVVDAMPFASRTGTPHERVTKRGLAAPRRDATSRDAVPSNGVVSSIVAASAMESQSAGMKFAKDVFAGTCGGVTVTLLGHPFDTVKVLLQTQSSKNPVYSGAVDAASKVIKAEGVGGLYRGVTSPLAGQMFFRATLFFAYARAKEFVGVSPDDPLSYAKAGAMAWLRVRFLNLRSICTSLSGSVNW